MSPSESSRKLQRLSSAHYPTVVSNESTKCGVKGKQFEMNNWTGVYPAVTTQFRKDLSIDFEATAAHIEVLIKSGISGLVMLGSLGENNSLLPEEKVEVIRLAISTSNGRVPVVSGVSELSTSAACTYAKKMEEIGADGLMVMPPMAYKAEADESIPYFRAVANASGLPIIIYNNPIAYHVDLKPEHFKVLSDEPKFVAIKESAGDTRRYTDLYNTVGDRYKLFAGVDDLIFECTALGATGWIAGISLAFPAENQYLWDLMMAGRWEEAREIYRWFSPLLHLDVGLKFVQNIKLAIQETGLGSEWVRGPRLPLVGEERERVLKTIRTGIANRPSIPNRVEA